jgi:exopolysaccharide production protein ExoZ
MKRELIAIQYLRGLAALLVVIYHLGPQIARLGYDGPWPAGLSAGVDIFFVISGFIMWVTTAERSVSPGAFWLNRIVRIVPLYWLVTCVMVVMLLVAPSLLQSSRFDLAHIVASFLFVPWVHPLRPEMSPVVLPGWTLNFEMFFYLLFGFCLLLPAKARLYTLVALLLLLSIAGGIFSPPATTVVGFYTRSVIVEFAFGMVLGHAFLVRRGLTALAPGAAWALLLVALAVMVAMPSSDVIARAIRYGIPAFAIVYAALTLELAGAVRENRLLHEIGNGSYSIYLTQLITMAAFTTAWRKAHLDALPGGVVLYCIAATVFTLAAMQ